MTSLPQPEFEHVAGSPKETHMITQPDTYIEARPTAPLVQREPHIPLPRRFTQSPNLALAGFQLLVGYAWLLAGIDKLLLGVFPAQLGGLLLSNVDGGHLPAFFVTLLRGLVMPNAVLFGSLIEWGETLAGLGLMTAGLFALLRPLAGRYLGGTSAKMFLFGARLLERLAPLAAAGAGLLGLNYFLLDGAPAQWFAPKIADGGAMDTGLFLAAASVVLIVSQFVQWRSSR
jgi:thiosulfate dehydrogenase [quinone] large subunit